MNSTEKLASSYIYWPELDPQFHKNISFGGNTLSSLTPLLSDAIKAKDSDPHQEIMEFYALNQHLASERLKEHNILDENLIETYQLYQEKVDELSQKMFCYLFTICMAEAKHSYDLNNGENLSSEQDLIDWMSDYVDEHDDDPSEKEVENMRKKLSGGYKKSQLSQYKKMCGSFYPQFVECFNFLDNTFKKHSSDYTNTMIKRMLPSLKESDLTIENMLYTVSIIFKKNSFNKSYGGDSWHGIAEHALKFSRGDINAEVFVDQSFSLEHNEGSIFNKEIIFNSVETFSTPTTVPKGKATLNSKNTLAMSKTQLVLNMQHAGELLNFLSLNNITNSQISQIVDNKKRHHPDLKGFDVSESLKLFFRGLKQEAASYSKSSFIKTLLMQNSQPSKINFNGFLSYITDEYQDKHYILNDKKKAIVALATEVASEFLTPVSKNKVELAFEAFDISNIPSDKQDKSILGGKAYGLSEMNKLGLPIPKAVVWTCQNSLSFNAYPKEWSKALKSQMAGINAYNRDQHGDVMVSIRSGAPVSMPGMMDTILNVGIDDSNYQYFSDKLGKHTTDACAIRFMKQFTQSYFDIPTKWHQDINAAVKKFRKILVKNEIAAGDGFFPLTKHQQIEMSIHAVFKSANSNRANAYREHHHIENLGTAVVMQHMVFGNLNHQSCTGVLFSRDCIKGDKGLIGEYLVCAQGEDVVSGEVTPQNISEMKKWNLQAYNQLSEIAAKLEEKTGQIQDIEFTIENNKVYILQSRDAVASHQAHIKILQEKLYGNKISLQDFLLQVEPQALRVGQTVNTTQAVDFNGLCANPGVLQAICIKSNKDIEKYSKQAKKEKLGFVFVAEETKPEHAPLMMASQAFITQTGGFTSHAAILARSWDKPCIVGADKSKSLKPGDIVTIDASQGVWTSLQPLENKRANPIVSEIISAFPIKITHERADKMNSFSDWRYLGNETQAATQKKFTKFLDMGYASVMKMSLAAKKQSSLKH